MKRVWMSLVLVAVLGFSGMASAALWDRGGGLIYDDVKNITWLQDVNYAKTSNYDDDGRMTWSEAVIWAVNLSYYDTVRDVTYDDWRLPASLPGGWSMGYNGTTTAGYNVTSSEMGYMYYTNLGNIGKFDVNGIEQSGYDKNKNAGPFINWQGEQSYWSGTLYDQYGGIDRAWYFYNLSGYQDVPSPPQGTLSLFAWAVRNGDVAPPAPAPVSTPVPGTMLLACSGLAGLGLIRKTRRSHG